MLEPGKDNTSICSVLWRVFWIWQSGTFILIKAREFPILVFSMRELRMHWNRENRDFSLFSTVEGSAANLKLWERFIVTEDNNDHGLTKISLFNFVNVWFYGWYKIVYVASISRKRLFVLATKRIVDGCRINFIYFFCFHLQERSINKNYQNNIIQNHINLLICLKNISSFQSCSLTRCLIIVVLSFDESKR